jgi:hypothetical protein
MINQDKKYMLDNEDFFGGAEGGKRGRGMEPR